MDAGIRYRSAGRIGHGDRIGNAAAAGAAAGAGVGKKKKKRVLTVGEMLNPVEGRKPAALQGKGRYSSGLSGVCGVKGEV